uniref:Uncharacterized protein n=1 Tax=Coccidioides posadasii RMSCC 3488 TaxID=454284 RepID=A0A0J6FUK0_COCPO|nr:hypothetical protein CPAG_09369 [Coccidioides posadasii RMSCC 3488]
MQESLFISKTTLHTEKRTPIPIGTYIHLCKLYDIYHFLGRTSVVYLSLDSAAITRPTFIEETSWHAQLTLTSGWHNISSINRQLYRVHTAFIPCGISLRRRRGKVDPTPQQSVESATKRLACSSAIRMSQSALRFGPAVGRTYAKCCCLLIIIDCYNAPYTILLKLKKNSQK